jgi:hypothetical protein
MQSWLEKITTKTVAIKEYVAIWLSQFVSRTVRCNACGNSSGRIWHNKLNFTFCKSHLVTFALTEAPHIRRIICRSYCTRAIKHRMKWEQFSLHSNNSSFPKLTTAYPISISMGDGLVCVRHVWRCVIVAGRCLLDQFISVLPLCICFSSPLLSPIHTHKHTHTHTHTHTTGLIFLQLSVIETVSLAPNATAPFTWGSICIWYSIINAVQYTAVAKLQLG